MSLIRKMNLQRTQIIRHVTELSGHLGIAKIAQGRITRATECDRTHMAISSRKRSSGLSRILSSVRV
jgi:hypothetical protein